MLRAAFAGTLIALLAGAMGSLILWRRMAYYGDALSHSALLGVAIGVIANVPTDITIVLVCIAIALLLSYLSQHFILPNDAIIGVLAQTSLALGLLASAYFMPQIDLMSYLVGDVITVSSAGLWKIFFIVVGCLVVVVWAWRSLLLITLNEDFARLQGVRVTMFNLLLTVLVGIVVALAIRIIGIIMIIALFIIPAVTARPLSKTPEQMAVMAAASGIIAVWAGLWLSLQLDTPAGPSIVLMACVGLVLVYLLLPPLRRMRQQ